MEDDEALAWRLHAEFNSISRNRPRRQSTKPGDALGVRSNSEQLEKGKGQRESLGRAKFDDSDDDGISIDDGSSSRDDDEADEGPAKPQAPRSAAGAGAAAVSSKGPSASHGGAQAGQEGAPTSEKRKLAEVSLDGPKAPHSHADGRPAAGGASGRPPLPHRERQPGAGPPLKKAKSEQLPQHDRKVKLEEGTLDKAMRPEQPASAFGLDAKRPKPEHRSQELAKSPSLPVVAAAARKKVAAPDRKRSGKLEDAQQAARSRGGEHDAPKARAKHDDVDRVADQGEAAVKSKAAGSEADNSKPVDRRQQSSKPGKEATPHIKRPTADTDKVSARMSSTQNALTGGSSGQAGPPLSAAADRAAAPGAQRLQQKSKGTAAGAAAKGGDGDRAPSGQHNSTRSPSSGAAAPARDAPDLKRHASAPAPAPGSDGRPAQHPPRSGPGGREPLAPARDGGAAVPGSIAPDERVVAADYAAPAAGSSSQWEMELARECATRLLSTSKRCADAENKVKCFYCGQRYGIWLSLDRIASRKLLAEALNEAYTGSIISCGKGERLYVIFIDAKGAVHQFPTLRGKDAQPELEAMWESVSQEAVRVVVRHQQSKVAESS